MTKIGFRDHDGGLSACCVADRWRLVVRWNVSNGIGKPVRHAAHSGRSRTVPWVMSHSAQCRRPSRAPTQYDSSPRNVASASYTPTRRTIR